MIHRTGHVHGLQERHQIGGAPLVHTFATRQHIHLVELRKQLGRRLVDGANDGATLLGQLLQQIHHLVAGVAIETTVRAKKDDQLEMSQMSVVEMKRMAHLRGGFVQEHDRRIVDQFESYRETLLLSTR